MHKTILSFLLIGASAMAQTHAVNSPNIINTTGNVEINYVSSTYSQSPPFIEMYRIPPGHGCRLQFNASDCFAFAEDLPLIARRAFSGTRIISITYPKPTGDLTGHEAALIYWALRVAVPSFNPDRSDWK